MADESVEQGTGHSRRSRLRPKKWEVDPARSRLMARVRSRDTSPELRVRRIFYRLGLRYRLHCKGLPGRPDLAFESRRLVVFVHGCFWHRHPGCKATRTPKSHLEFWKGKFDENVERDKRVKEKLLLEGWSVLTIWECETLDVEYLKELALGIKGLPTKRRA